MLTNAAPFADPITWSSCAIIFSFRGGGCLQPADPAEGQELLLENKSDTIYAIGRIGSAAVCLALLIIVSILLVDSTNNVFLYFRF